MYTGRRMHSDISPGFLGPSSILCCNLLQCTMHQLHHVHLQTDLCHPSQMRMSWIWGGDNLPAPAPALAPAAPVHPPDLPAPAAVIVPPASLLAPPAVHPAPAALHDHSQSPSPPAPRRSTRQRFEPRLFWISNAPLVPIHQDPPRQPGPSASPAPAPSDQESYHQDSEDEQGAEIAHQVWGSVLEAAGIYPEDVEMETDDAWELAFSTKHMLHLVSCQCQRLSSRLWLAQKRHSGRRHASRRLLHTWRMVLGDLLNSLMAAHPFDRTGYSTSSALQMGPSSAIKRVWLPKDSPNDLGGTTSSPLHPPSGSLSCVLSLHLLLQMTLNATSSTLSPLS